MEATLYDTFLNVGQQAFARGDWSQAQEAFQAAVSECEASRLGPSSLALALNNLAAALHRRGQLDDAIAVSEQVLVGYSEAGGLGSYSGEIVVALVNLAELYMAGARWAAAETALLSAAEKFSEQVDDAARQAQKELLAQLYTHQEKFPEARAAYYALLEHLRSYSPEPADEVARIYHILSNMEEAIGEEEAAAVSRQECLTRLRALWLPEYPGALAEVLSNIAESLAAADKHGVAVGYLEEAIRMLQISSEPDSAHKLEATQLLAMGLLRESGQPQKGLDLGMELVEKWEDPASVAKLLAEIGLCHFLLGDFSQARDFFQKASDSPLARQDVHFRISALYNLATAQQGLETSPLALSKESEATYSLALSLAQEYLPPGHGLTARIVWNYSGLLEQNNDSEGANKMREQFGSSL